MDCAFDANSDGEDCADGEDAKPRVPSGDDDAQSRGQDVQHEICRPAKSDCLGTLIWLSLVSKADDAPHHQGVMRSANPYVAMQTIKVQISKKHVLKEKASEGNNCSYHICALRRGDLNGRCDALLIILVNLVRGWRNRVLPTSAAKLDNTVLPGVRVRLFAHSDRLSWMGFGGRSGR